MRRYLALAAVLLVTALAIARLSAQTPPGSIVGVIRDSNRQGVAATISLFDAAARVTTTRSDVQGKFTFAGVTPGRYVMSVTKPGFALLSQAVVVRSGQALDLRLTLQTIKEQSDAERDRSKQNRPAPAQEAGSPVSSGIVGGVVGSVPGRASFEALSPAAPAMRVPFNTESYDRIDDNRWTPVRDRPLSTFSIDVDTASYANVRRFLNAGQLPPKDAVRIEELINYFSYDYPEPNGDEPLSIVTAMGEAPWNRRHRLVLVGLQAKHLDASRLPARNLVFLIDVSGSMQAPNKLPLVKASLALLARNLTSNDRIAVVVYAGAAGMVLPPTAGSDTSTILAALSQLEAGGSTNGAQGIELAYRIAHQHFIRGGVNRVILATDGDFNVGTSNAGDLTRLIEQQRTTGINLSVLGFGMGNLKDSTMEALADRGDGNYAYIDSLSEAQKVLVEQAGGTLVMIAKDVKVQVEFNPRVVGAYRLIGYENRLLRDHDFNDDRKDAGDMGAGHSVTALYELIPAGERLDIPGIDPLKYQRPAATSGAAASGEAMTVKVRYKSPGSDTSRLTSVAVRTGATDTPELGFASAVAEFGMLLRDSEFKSASTFADVRTRARRFKGDDAHGHRSEFIRLIDVAESVLSLKSNQH